jgi:formylglycine-generating enzyme required for sulfatase activity
MRPDFFRRAASLLTRDAFDSVPELQKIWTELCGDDIPPDGYEPALAGGDLPVQTATISQVGAEFEFCRSGESLGNSSLIGSVRFRNPRMELQQLADTAGSSVWGFGEQPDWATDSGEDEFGLWCEFQVNGTATEQSDTWESATVTQRMRWIPPGTFLMGSPDGEDGRYDDEGPQHEVTISDGYWMFDTPVTQQLWKAVMDSTPSHFEGDKRPVEQVSWEDAQQFRERLNEALPGLHLNLPTEAQWEYACRAGTQTATYRGDLDIKGGREKEQLRGVAWYAENSDCRTHDVAENPPNPWGLFDMLGNVNEWCEDQWCGSYDAERTSAGRVIRGGGWSYSAQSVRAAYRNRAEAAKRRATTATNENAILYHTSAGSNSWRSAEVHSTCDVGEQRSD